LLALVSANHSLDLFELTALAYDLEPDDHGRVVVSAAHLASVKRALTVLFREGLAIDFRAGLQGSHCARTAPEPAGRLWFWMELDNIGGCESRELEK